MRAGLGLCSRGGECAREVESVRAGYGRRGGERTPGVGRARAGLGVRARGGEWAHRVGSVREV